MKEIQKLDTLNTLDLKSISFLSIIIVNGGSVNPWPASNSILKQLVDLDQQPFNKWNPIEAINLL